MNVEGYTWFGHCRFGKHKKAPKTFGGVGIFIRNDILMEYLISIVDQSFDGILILKCKHKFSEFVFIICEAYLAPENSPWGRDASSFYNVLVSQIYKYSNVEYFIICGDLNSRFGKENDYIPDIDYLPDRKILDFSKNQHGHSLLEFLLETSFCVVNGRVIPDHDDFTNVSTKGRSVVTVDYFLVPHSIINNCNNFDVLRCTEIVENYNLKGLVNSKNKIPDHSVLLLDIKFDFYLHKPTLSVSPSVINNFKYVEYDMKNIPSNFMSSDSVLHSLRKCKLDFEFCRETQNDIDKCYIQFLGILHMEMEENLTPVYNQHKNIKLNPFWNIEMEELWKNKKHAEKYLAKCSISGKTRAITDFKRSCKLFDYKFRILERKFKRKGMEHIDKLKNTNPKLFWEEIKKLAPNYKQSIPLEIYGEIYGFCKFIFFELF